MKFQRNTGMLLLIYLILFSSLSLNSESVSTSNQFIEEDYSIENNIVVSQFSDRIEKASLFFSQYVHADLEIFVSLPNTYHISDAAYSTVYLLDGDWYFNASSESAYSKTPMDNGLSGIIQNLVVNKGYDDVILIGIGYEGDTMRGRDFWSNMDDFHKFIQYELVPYVDDNYRTTKVRSLFGHSSGGNFVLYDLLHYPHVVFHNYVALSWVFYEDNYQLVKAMDILIEKYVGIKFNISLYLGVGLLEPTRFLTSFDKIVDELDLMQFTHFKFNYIKYVGLDHGTIVGPGFSDGFEWIYRKNPYALFSANYTNSKIDDNIKFTFKGHDGAQPSYLTWDFDDGGPISQEHDPIHQFNEDGSYLVNLTIKNEFGSQSSTLFVNVSNKPINNNFGTILIITSISLGSIMLLVFIKKYTNNSKRSEIRIIN
ncbi:MAG: PKD domain-containing protein [Candidatus Heimdallarchaeota archaeon]|nr:PKD domain-containing protein [Candidatus Heimdallarchaeota archaeon]